MRRLVVAGVAVAGLALGGCTGGGGSHGSPTPSSSPSGSSAPGAVTVNGLPASRSTAVRDEGAAAAPGKGIAFASHVYSLGPSGALPQSAHVTIRLDRAFPAGTPVIIATRESASAPWTYLPGTLSTDGHSASFTTTHFSLFGVVWIDLKDAVAAFKTDFVDGIDGGATQTVSRPSCASESTARQDGYNIISSSTDTVYWCFGVENGHRVLKMVDHRRYPLEVAHPNMSTLSNDYDHSALSALSHLGSGGYAILAPGGTATFNADLSPGGTEGVSTMMDGLGQSLYALQTGVETLLEILTRFGAGSGTSAIDAVDKLLGIRSCADAVSSGSSGELISGCFSAKDILDAFGVTGLLLAPIMAAGPIIAFFHSEYNALIDQFNGHDKYTVTVARKRPASRLGYDNALAEWKSTVGAEAAVQNIIFADAARDLQRGQSTDGGDISGYAAAIKNLETLASLPSTGLSAGQQAEAQSALAALDRFFGFNGVIH